MTQVASSAAEDFTSSMEPEPLSRPNREHARPGFKDPLGPVFVLGRRATRIGMAIGLACGTTLHAGGVGAGMSQPLVISGFAERLQRTLRDRLKSTYDVEIDRTPPPPAPPPEPLKPEPADPTPRAAAPADQPKVEEPPPPAEAGKVLTADSDPDEPVDLTGNTFVTGSSDRYVGGTTTSQGTSKKAVYNAQPKGTGTVDAPRVTEAPKATAPTQDLSRSPVPVERSWNDCGFPPDADVEGIDYMQVRIIVTVGPEGRAKSVSVLKDPGYGFGARARLCAMRKVYTPGLDPSGRPVIMTTAPFPVTFTR